MTAAEPFNKSAAEQHKAEKKEERRMKAVQEGSGTAFDG